MSEIDRWLANLDLELSGASLNPLEGFVLGGDVFNLTELRDILTQAKEARRQALEEAAKIADTIMRGEVTGLKLDSSYRAGIRWAGERIKDAIRALASDAAKK